ncbi:MAG: Hvo_1808 family surface protein [Halobacteriaceae archaeon]
MIRNVAICLVVASALTGSALHATRPADAVRATGRPPDPADDVLGWEEGYWYNESLSITQSDGLNGSERRALVTRTMARVEHIRRLEFRRDVPIVVRNRSTFRRRVRNGSTNATRRLFDNVKFEALLLVGESAGSVAVQNENTATRVLGFYSPARNRIVVIAENDSAVRLDELTLAHELVHALQDQHFNLTRYDGATRDGVNALDGLIEGDAEYVTYLYGQQRCNDASHPWNGTCVTPSDRQGGSGEGDDSRSDGGVNYGIVVLKSLPYSDGPAFVHHVRERGGWSAVNALYEAPPVSAEQVVTPSKYQSDLPASPSLRDRTTASWVRVRPPGRPDYAEVGLGGVAAMLVRPLYHSEGRAQIVSPEDWFNRTASGTLSTFEPVNYSVTAADGWEGDRMHVYRRPATGETAYVWRIRWESGADAAVFLDTYLEVLEYWGAEQAGPRTWVIDEGPFADAFYVTRANSTVTIVNAPTREQLPAVWAPVAADRSTTSPGTTTGPGPGPTTDPSVTTAGSTTDPSVTTADPRGRDESTAAPPTTRSTTARRTTTPGVPGFGVVGTLAAVAATAASLRRWRRGRP